MKLLLVIDHFGLGGAQRQLVELACGLAQRGHVVESFIYFPQYDFFRSRIAAAGIRVHEFPKGPGFSFDLLRRLAAVLREGQYDLVVSFLNSPNVYAELARLVRGGPALVVSERCSFHDDTTVVAPFLRRLLHAAADHVVTNSETHAKWLSARPWLRSKASCIYNGVDVEALSMSRPPAPAPGELRLLAVGRVCAQKNVKKLIEALHLMHDRHGYVPFLSWAGKREEGPEGERYCGEVDALLQSLPHVKERWRWLGQQSDMARLLAEHHALIHPSLYEGLPNAVCEALAAGMPVLASSVCDHPLLVADGKRGFLFDPTDSHSIADAISKLAGASDWLALSENARSFAREHLGIARMVTAYEELFIGLVGVRHHASVS